LPLDGERWLGNVRAAKIQPLIKTTDKVFEYGVGFGWNLMALECGEKIGFDVAGVVRSTVEARGIHFVENPRQVLAGSMDVVLCHHTLEHLVNPAEALETMFELLKSAGKLLLFTPYEIERKYRRYEPARDKAHHLYSWTPSTLANLVQARNFRIDSVRLQPFRFDRAAAVAALKFHLGEAGYRLVRRVGLMLLPEYEIALVAHKT
jgi:SAM-dependent methyltransferase